MCFYPPLCDSRIYLLLKLSSLIKAIICFFPAEYPQFFRQTRIFSEPVDFPHKCLKYGHIFHRISNPLRFFGAVFCNKVLQCLASMFGIQVLRKPLEPMNQLVVCHKHTVFSLILYFALISFFDSPRR